jgi:serine/threonine-protein kinase
VADNPVEADEEPRGSLPDGALVGGRFKIERLIGRGGMGEVYAARHNATGKEVALKVIRSAQGSGKDHVRRFMREARAATAIQHPNVIEVFDVFADAEGNPVMVMELLKGEPFSRYRERAGALRLHETATLLLPAVRALRAAHEKGIVHRDLKPDNVFLASTPDGGRTTKVLDFGIAKVLDPARISSETQGQQTNTGSILGTPHYMSFEQAMSDKAVDHRTDIWAMGVMIFEALTGRRPLTYDTLGQMYATFLQGTVPSIREFVPDLPLDVAASLDRCLAKERAARMDNLGPLIDVLERYADPRVPGATTGGVVVPAPVMTPAQITAAGLTASVSGGSARRSRAPLAIAAVTVVALAVGGGVFALTRPGPTRGESPAVPSPAPSMTAATAAATVTTAAAAASASSPAASTAVAVTPTTAAPPVVHTTTGASVLSPAAPHHPGPSDTGTAHPVPPAAPAPSPSPPPSKQGIYEKPPY